MTLAYTVRPISDRGPFRGEHENSQFTASWSDTLEVLERELWHLDAEHVVVEVDVAERGIRVDGQLRADARAASPAVRLAFDSRVGPLTYATDRFVRPSWQRKGSQQDWQHNLRAIALGLEALRKVDRYGITRRGEQYAGWKALPSGAGGASAPPGIGTEIAMPGAMSVERAALVLAELGAELGSSTTRTADRLLLDPDEAKRLYRRAAAAHHPDRGGDRVAWDRLQQARDVLEHHA